MGGLVRAPDKAATTPPGVVQYKNTAGEINNIQKCLYNPYSPTARVEKKSLELCFKSVQPCVKIHIFTIS